MAARYFIAGGVNNNWSTSGNWSATDGGAASGVKPSAADDVHFTVNSPACTVDTAGVGLSIDFTGYTNTITMTAGLTISGSVTLVAAMTITGASGLTVNATATLTSNGKVWPNPFTITHAGSVTFTFADDWTVSGLLTLGTGTATTTLSGQTINAGAGLTESHSSGTTIGTTSLVLNGTGTVSTSNTTGGLRINLTINTAGTITFANGSTFGYGTGILTYIAGTVITTGSTMDIITATTTLAVSGIVWNNVTITGSTTTVTFNENLNLTGLLTLGTTTNAIVLTGNTINAGGGITCGLSTGSVTGTATIVVNGTGAFTASSMTTGRFNIAMVFNAPDDTLTVSSPFYVNLGLLSYISGTVAAGNTWATGGGNSNFGSVGRVRPRAF